MANKQRLQKILAAAGYGSRRACEEVVRQGRVTVNGQIAQLGDSADPTQDAIRVDGRRVRVEARLVTVALYKPRGVVTTLDDERGRKTVRELVPVEGHLVPVGRLDVDSEGLLLLSSDGDLVNRLTHPRFEHEKEYQVFVLGRPAPETLEKWRRGVMLDDHMTLPARVSVIRSTEDGTWLRVVMREGRKRQIRDTASLLGHPVRRLIRVRVGPVRLGNLKSGEWRYLTDQEMRELNQLKGRG